MELELYDTLTREKRPFEPLDPERVRMYVCGPTVYDFAHIGNARPVIVFDVLFRLLRHLYGAEHVIYVRNITDVDDKINKRAAERIAARGETNADLNAEIRSSPRRPTATSSDDAAALGCLPPTVEPRATEHIEEMKALIERLVAGRPRLCGRGARAVQRALDAGLRQALEALARRDDRGRARRGRALQARSDGFRAVEAVEARRAGLAVALRASRRPAGPAGTSNARPCRGSISARPSTSTAAASISCFPHHENEIAQSRCAFHTPVMANFWMHNGFLQVEGEKMSKSLGNFFTIREVLRDWPGDVIRLAMLETHYRQPINWTRRRPGGGQADAVDHWYALTADAEPGTVCADVLDALARRPQHAEGDRRDAWLASEAVKGARRWRRTLGLVSVSARRRAQGVAGQACCRAGAARTRKSKA